jgi:hypothetical protein
MRATAPRFVDGMARRSALGFTAQLAAVQEENKL